MASIRDTLANLVEQYKQSDTPLANLMRGDTEGAKQSVANALQQATQDPYAGLNVLGTTKIVSKTAQELAHELASKNAEKMLGLPAGNTAMERAKALGFDVENPMYHGTTKDFPSFEKTKDIGFHFGNPEQANNINIMNRNWDNASVKNDANIIPVYLKTKNTLPTKDWGNDWNFSVANQLKNENIISPQEYEEFRLLGNKNQNWNELTKNLLKNKGYDSLEYKNIHESSNSALQNPNSNLNSTIILEPKNIRSQFAAFDPARANEPDLLAGAMALPIATDKDKRNKLIDLLKQQ